MSAGFWSPCDQKAAPIARVAKPPEPTPLLRRSSGAYGDRRETRASHALGAPQQNLPRLDAAQLEQLRRPRVGVQAGADGRLVGGMADVHELPLARAERPAEDDEAL